MGESKRKQQHHAKSADLLGDVVPRVAHAIRRLAMAASPSVGSDCYLHAALGRQLLADLGIEARVVTGYAAWRVGPGDGDVISHTHQETSYLPQGAIGFAYHAWLACTGHVIDFTTYQLQRKAADLDAADNGTTTVEWCPLFLLIPYAKICRYREVAAALTAGHAYYEEDPALHQRLGPSFTLDPADVDAARLLYANPQMTAMGPNDID